MAPGSCSTPTPCHLIAVTPRDRCSAWLLDLQEFITKTTDNGNRCWQVTQARTSASQFVPDNLKVRWNCLMSKALDFALDTSAPDMSRLFIFALPGLALGYTNDLAPSAQMTAIMNGRFETVWEHHPL